MAVRSTSAELTILIAGGSKRVSFDTEQMDWVTLDLNTAISTEIIPAPGQGNQIIIRNITASSNNTQNFKFQDSKGSQVGPVFYLFLNSTLNFLLRLAFPDNESVNIKDSGIGGMSYTLGYSISRIKTT